MKMLFLSNFCNKIDSKGRVSLPSDFRSVANADGKNVIFLYKSITKNCLEGADLSYIDNINKMISEMDPFSEERDAFSTAIFGDGIMLEFDKDGRIIIPRQYLDFAGISGEAFFVGKGLTFEIWEPKEFDNFAKKCRDFALKNTKLLKNQKM